MVNIFYILALIIIIRQLYFIKKNLKKMAVTDAQVAQIVTQLQATLQTLSTDLNTVITDITGAAGVSDETLANLQAVATGLGTAVTSIDTAVNPPAPEAPQA